MAWTECKAIQAQNTAQLTQELAKDARDGGKPGTGTCEKIDLANSGRFFGRPKMYREVANIVHISHLNEIFLDADLA
jgi:hypothetical protein